VDDLIPDIEDDVPIPGSIEEALPELSPAEELNMRARTIKLLADLKGDPILPTLEHEAEARDLAHKMMSDPALRPDYAKYPNETMAYLAGMIAQSNCMLVEELADLKLYVVNKLILEVENAKDSKSRITALSKLGEVDGVDAFKKRSEVTMQVKPIQEVEKELLSVLDGIEYSVRTVDPVPAERRLADADDVVELETKVDDIDEGQNHTEVYEQP
jgi:hypothetical protein